MLTLLKRVLGLKREKRIAKEKKVYITPELDAEMLAKKKAVYARRAAFWKTLSAEERRKRQFELDMRIRTDTPLQFRWVGIEKGVPVGFPLFIFHISLHDMLTHECDNLLTEEYYLAGLKCNAVSRGRFVQIAELEAFVEVQPRWVDAFGEPPSAHRRSL